MQKKKIGRPQSVIYYNTKILQEETCKEAISKKNYLVFLGIQKMCLRLRVKVNSEAIKNKTNKFDEFKTFFNKK